MTNPNDDKDPEASLASLFDRTANALSDEGRARLDRGARDIGNVRPRSGRTGFGVWVPALAAAAAVVYLAVPKGHPAMDNGAPSASAAFAGEASATTSAPAVPPAIATEETEPEDPAFAVLEGEPSDVEPFDLGPLMGGQEFRGRGATREGPALGERQRERSAP